MSLDRRQLLLKSLAAGVTWSWTGCGGPESAGSDTVRHDSGAIRTPDGQVDWRAVRALFPLATDRVHLASFLLVSHPKPVAEAIAHFRERLDADPLWLEDAAFGESEGRPFTAVKTALAGYMGGTPDEICVTGNTTQALAIAYHGLRIRSDQEIVTTEHDHYSQHESIRYAATRSGCGVRRIALYDRSADASAADIVERVARAIRPSTRAVGITWVHSSTGVKLPVGAIAETVARANRGRASADRCLLIVDGVHGFGNQDVDVARLGCDFFATGTHKWLFAPRGTGCLWGRSDAWTELQPTIPTFDPEAPEPWDAWMERSTLPPTRASFVSPGGFVAYEHQFAIPAAVDLHRSIGRDRIAERLATLNAAFREEVARIPGITLHTPLDPELAGPISCFEVAGFTPDEVTSRLAVRQIRVSPSPYKVVYVRVAAGVMNLPEEIDRVLAELRALARPAAA